jgi:hypothetical protein
VRLATALMSLCSEDGRLCQCRGFPCIAPSSGPALSSFNFSDSCPTGTGLWEESCSSFCLLD